MTDRNWLYHLKRQQDVYESDLSPTASIHAWYSEGLAPPIQELWYNTAPEFPFVLRGGASSGWQRFKDSVEGNPRLDLTLFVGNRAAGYACIVLDYDMHCGFCWSVQWHFVYPKYRGSSLARRVMRILRNLHDITGLPYAYSKMQQDGSIKITYKGI